MLVTGLWSVIVYRALVSAEPETDKNLARVRKKRDLVLDLALNKSLENMLWCILKNVLNRKMCVKVDHG